MGEIALNIHPNPKQARFFEATSRHIGYGGARGGGKSWAMRAKFIMLALKYPGLKILLLRRTLKELQENHVMPLLMETRGLAQFKETDKTFKFVTGSRIVLGYCELEKDVLQYQGHEYDVIGLEEATHFTETQMQFLTTCNRGTRTDFKPRMYYTSNPGGVGHGWFKRLFLDKKYRQREKPEDYLFIPARVYDNKALMDSNPEYIDHLLNLPEVQRRAFLDGDWNVFAGQAFKEWREDIHTIDPFMLAPHWKKWGSNDPGYTEAGTWYWHTADEQGNVYTYREAVFKETTYTEQARRVRSMTGDEQVEFWVTGMDAFVREKGHEDGKTPVEYYEAGGIFNFRKPVHGKGARMAMAGTAHEYLRPVPTQKAVAELVEERAMEFIDPVLGRCWRRRDGSVVTSDQLPQTSRCRIFKHCRYLIETLPALSSDENNPEQVSDEGEDHGYQGWGYGLQAHHAEKSKRPDYERALPGSAADVLRHRDILSPPKKAKDPFGV